MRKLLIYFIIFDLFLSFRASEARATTFNFTFDTTFNYTADAVDVRGSFDTGGNSAPFTITRVTGTIFGATGYPAGLQITGSPSGVYNPDRISPAIYLQLNFSAANKQAFQISAAPDPSFPGGFGAFLLGGGRGEFEDRDEGTFSLTPAVSAVPLPSSLSLFGMALLGLGCFSGARRYRQVQRIGWVTTSR